MEVGPREYAEIAEIPDFHPVPGRLPWDRRSIDRDNREDSADGVSISSDGLYLERGSGEYAEIADSHPASAAGLPRMDSLPGEVTEGAAMLWSR